MIHLLAYYLIFVIPTIVVSMLAIYLPVYHTIAKRFPRCYVAKHKITYFTASILTTTFLAPVVFGMVFFGNIEKRKALLFNKLSTKS